MLRGRRERRTFSPDRRDGRSPPDDAAREGTSGPQAPAAAGRARLRRHAALVVAEFTSPLHLASPTEQSARVKDAQRVLSGGNVFQQDFHPGTVDGEWGPLSAT